jgi:hypothetical protein
MSKYPNASSKTEIDILKTIDTDGYNKEAFREVLGKMLVPDEDRENKVKLGTIRESFAKGDITPQAYLMSLENNSSSGRPEFQNHLTSLREIIKDPNEYSISKYAEDEVRMMRGSSDKEAPNEEIATAITHQLLKYKYQEDISFDDTHKNLHGVFKNAKNFLEPDTHNYIREVFVNNPEKAMEVTGSPSTVAPKEDKEHPMMPKIWKALDIARGFREKVLESELFDRFPPSVKENQVRGLANVSNASLVIFGESEEVNKSLSKAHDFNLGLLSAKKNKKNASLSM